MPLPDPLLDYIVARDLTIDYLSFTSDLYLSVLSSCLFPVSLRPDLSPPFSELLPLLERATDGKSGVWEEKWTISKGQLEDIKRFTSLAKGLRPGQKPSSEGEDALASRWWNDGPYEPRLERLSDTFLLPASTLSASQRQKASPDSKNNADRKVIGRVMKELIVDVREEGYEREQVIPPSVDHALDLLWTPDAAGKEALIRMMAVQKTLRPINPDTDRVDLFSDDASTDTEDDDELTRPRPISPPLRPRTDPALPIHQANPAQAPFLSVIEGIDAVALTSSDGNFNVQDWNRIDSVAAHTAHPSTPPNILSSSPPPPLDLFLDGLRSDTTHDAPLEDRLIPNCQKDVFSIGAVPIERPLFPASMDVESQKAKRGRKSQRSDFDPIKFLDLDAFSNGGADGQEVDEPGFEDVFGKADGIDELATQGLEVPEDLQHLPFKLGVPKLLKPVTNRANFDPPPFSVFRPDSTGSLWRMARQEGLKALNIDLSWTPIVFTKPAALDRLADVEELLIPNEEADPGETDSVIDDSVIGYRARDHQSNDDGAEDGDPLGEAIRIMSPSPSRSSSLAPSRQRDRDASVESNNATSAASEVETIQLEATSIAKEATAHRDDGDTIIEDFAELPPVFAAAATPRELDQDRSVVPEALDDELSTFEPHHLSPIVEDRTSSPKAEQRSSSPIISVPPFRHFTSSDPDYVHLVGDPIPSFPQIEMDSVPEATFAPIVDIMPDGPVPQAAMAIDEEMRTEAIDLPFEASSISPSEGDHQPFTLVDRRAPAQKTQPLTARETTALEDVRRPSVSSPGAEINVEAPRAGAIYVQNDCSEGPVDALPVRRQDVASSLRHFAAARWDFCRASVPATRPPTSDFQHTPALGPLEEIEATRPPTAVPAPPETIPNLYRIEPGVRFETLATREGACSMRLLQNRRLHHELASRLALHDSLDTASTTDDFVIAEPDLVTGSGAAIVYLRLNALPRAVMRHEELEVIDSEAGPAGIRDRPEAAFSTVYRLAQTFARVMLVFEAYPSKPTSGLLPYPYTPPILQALADLHDVIRQYVDYLRSADVDLVCDVALAESPQIAADITLQWIETLER